ncbi:peptidylprolyl isomerase [archaeon]|nr:peptidylprolyl isomerase [archaeon]MBT6869563.1 peptidylprolyl isomerase [archaeon]MBT7193445.1 peptidylprolyl isomerase [archaeon]MBT7381036.1 peptidylprolyl isomerase [archaeon]
MAVENGNKIKVEYTGTFDDGTVFDSSEKHGQPLEFEVGAGMVIKGFDDAVIGMEVGDEKEVKIEAKDAYGEPNDQMKQKVPKDQLPKDQKPEVGMVLGVSTPDGKQFPAKIIEVNDDTITIDLNHPLAGKNLNFKLKLVSIEESSAKKPAQEEQPAETPVEESEKKTE